MGKLVSALEAVQCIADGDVVTAACSSGLNCPDAVLAAVGDRFAQDGAPRGITMLQPIAAGDSYGIKGIEHLTAPGLIARVIAGSYPSGPSSLPMPGIWKLIVDNEIPAYNVPSGILFDMMREAAAKRPGVMTKVGLETFVDPDQEGCAMNARAVAAPIVQKVNFANDEWLFFPTIAPTVAIIRATTADERGNLSFEHEGAFVGALDQAIAARNNGGTVIAQVKRMVRAGTIKPQDVHVPGMLVDKIVVVSDQWQATQTVHDPAMSGEIQQPLSMLAFQEWAPEKVIARRAAQDLSPGTTANLGFGVAANVPRILLEEGLHGEVTWAIEQGAVGGVPLLGFGFGCSSNAEAILPSPNQFSYFQGGGFDVTLLSFLQIDRSGNVNVSKLGAKPYLTAGCGGFVDITARARRILFCGFFTAGAALEVGGGILKIRKEGRSRKLVEAVEQITFNGQRALRQGQKVTYITERCVMDLTNEGLVVREIAPGIDLQRDVLALADFPLQVDANLKQMDPALFTDALMHLQLKGVSAA